MIRFDCPYCRHGYSVGPEMAGQAATCVGCGGQFVVPSTIAAPLMPVYQPPQIAPPQSVFVQPVAEPQPRTHTVEHRARGSTGAGFGLGFGAVMGGCAAVCLIVFLFMLWVASRGDLKDAKPDVQPAVKPAPRVEPPEPRADKDRTLVQSKRIYLEARKLLADDPEDTVLAAFMARHSVIPRELDRILEAGDKAKWPGHEFKRR